MSLPALTPGEEAHFNDTRQPELWGCFITFLVINNVAVAGRLWGTWISVSSRSRVFAEDAFIFLSGVFANAILANLMVATHYGLGLHLYTINARDPDYPSNLSKTFRHVWITMVLMSSFFLCIKMTLLLFYKRLFLISHSRLRIYWWANLVYIILWFIGSTGFYLFQCQPVQWYFLQYFARFKRPVPGGMVGQCDATSVTHVAMPLIFSLINDVALLLLPVWAISMLRLDKRKKMGLMAVFGIGLTACLLELGRILALVIDTDDKNDPSYGVAVFLILTAAEESTAVVCACLPVVGPQLFWKLKNMGSSYASGKNSGPSQEVPSGGRSGSRNWRHKHSFHRVQSVNHIPTTINGGLGEGVGGDDYIQLTSIEATNRTVPDRFTDDHELIELPFPNLPTTRPENAEIQLQNKQYDTERQALAKGSGGDILVQTNIEVNYKTRPSGS